jgi:hypothetical protein
MDVGAATRRALALKTASGALTGKSLECTTTVPKLISTLDSSRDRGNLSSAIRVFVLDHYREVPSTGTRLFIAR